MDRRESSGFEGPSRSAMTARYGVALLIIAVLAIGNYLAMDHLVGAQADRARLLERTARQRMLVQRTVLLSQRLVEGVEPVAGDSLRRELWVIGRQIHATHDSLVHSDAGYEQLADLSGQMREAYTHELPGLDDAIHAYVRSLDRLSSAPVLEVEAGNEDLRRIRWRASAETSELLDHVVLRLVKRSEAETEKIRAIARIMLAGTLAGLWFVAVFIFEPLVRRILRKRQLLESANRELARLSTLDGLTNVGNRRWFEERIQQEWRRAQRDRTSLSLLMIDLDDFKAYNDLFGHRVGDDCLVRLTRDIAARLRRPGDFLARYGGEEFAVLLPDTDPAGARIVARDLRRRTLALALPHPGSSVASVVTVSIGVATARPDPDGATGPSELVVRADRALYEAKRAGRNRVRTATPEPRGRVSLKLPAPYSPA